MRNSSVAVAPRISFARAVSCTPGNCTTIRFSPCFWMTGSATPSSLTRLRSVVTFCWTAKRSTSLFAVSPSWISSTGSPTFSVDSTTSSGICRRTTS